MLAVIRGVLQGLIAAVPVYLALQTLPCLDSSAKLFVISAHHTTQPWRVQLNTRSWTG